MPGHGHRSRPNPLCVQEAIANEDKALEDLVSVANVVSRLNLYSLLYTSSVWCWCGKTTGLSYVPIFLGIVTAHNVLSIWGVWQNVEGYLLAWATLRLLPSGNWSTRVWRRLKPSQLQRRNFWNWGWVGQMMVLWRARLEFRLHPQHRHSLLLHLKWPKMMQLFD